MTIHSSKRLYVDCETTGLEVGTHAIIQAAGIVEINGKLQDRFNVFLRPEKGQFVSRKALEVQGRTIEQIKAFPEAKEGYVTLLRIFDGLVDRFDKRDKLLWIGQNPRFDYSFLNDLFNRFKNPYLYAYIDYHLIDIGAIAQAMRDAKKLECENLKLESIAKAFGVAFEPHNALADVQAVYEIYQKMIILLKDSLPLKL